MDNVAEMIKWGVVSSIDPVKATARVTFADRDNSVSYDLPITFANTGFAKMYTMPKVGQPVKCSFLGTGMEDGFIDGSFYNDSNPPAKTGNVHYIAFDDGALVEYDADRKIMTLKSAGGGIVLDDMVTITKGLTVSEDVIASGISLISHTHSGVQSGGSNTGGPQ